MGDDSYALLQIANSLNKINQTLEKILHEMQVANKANPDVPQEEKEKYSLWWNRL